MTDVTADRMDLWALVGCSGLMLVMLVLTWYSASLGGSSVTASGFSAVTILAIVVIALAGVIGAVAISFLRVADVLWIFASKRDLAHLAIFIGIFLGVWYVYRAANPPRFYQVTDFAPSFNGIDDLSVNASISVHPPLIMSIASAAGFVIAGLRLARRQPGGFEGSYCFGVLREIWRRR